MTKIPPIRTYKTVLVLITLGVVLCLALVPQFRNASIITFSNAIFSDRAVYGLPQPLPAPRNIEVAWEDQGLTSKANKKNVQKGPTTTQDQKSIITQEKGSTITLADKQVLLVEIFPSWTTSDPHDTVFTRRVYLYSAFVTLHKTPPSGSDVHIVAFQEGKDLLGLKCCFKPPGKPATLQGAASHYAELGNARPNPASKDLSVHGVVYNCHFSLTAQQLGAGHVTLTPESCPAEEQSYVKVGVPEKRPGGLGLCGKVAYGHELDPRKLVEWFEMQKLQGVDKILLYDLNNTETVRRIFEHYRQTGLLDLLSYKLPGRKWGRDMAPKNIVHDDEYLPLWDCRLRFAGYDYVLGIDMDEIVMPRKETRLKPFLQQQFQKRPGAASLFFDVQFFISDWGPVDPSAPLLLLQYLNSTYVRRECYKYVYIPARTRHMGIHTVQPYPGHSTFTFISRDDATLFHYRKCPHVWKTCNPPRMTDKNMLRFKDELVPRVQAATKELGLPAL